MTRHDQTVVARPFDIVADEPPNEPFRALPSIAARARILLGPMSNKKIQWALDTVDWLTLQQAKVEYADYIAGIQHECPPEAPRLSMDDIPEADEVDLLKHSLADFELDQEELPNAKVHDYFAALSLLLVAKAVHWLQYPAGVDQQALFAGECALKAMESVCYAEHMAELERLHSQYAHIVESKDRELHMTREQLSALNEQVDVERKKKSLRTQDLLIARHAKPREARQIVCELWGRNPSEFPSAEKAGNAYAERLRRDYPGKDYNFEPRTVRDWILAFAKSQNIVMR